MGSVSLKIQNFHLGAPHQPQMHTVVRARLAPTSLVDRTLTTVCPHCH
jgi:hypothetical protein